MSERRGEKPGKQQPTGTRWWFARSIPRSHGRAPPPCSTISANRRGARERARRRVASRPSVSESARGPAAFLRSRRRIARTGCVCVHCRLGLCCQPGNVARPREVGIGIRRLVGWLVFYARADSAAYVSASATKARKESSVNSCAAHRMRVGVGLCGHARRTA